MLLSVLRARVVATFRFIRVTLKQNGFKEETKNKRNLNI